MPDEPMVSVPLFAVRVPPVRMTPLVENVPPDKENAASFPAVPVVPEPPLAAIVRVPERVVVPTLCV